MKVASLSRREVLRQAGLLGVGLAVTAVPGWPATWFQEGDTIVPFTDIPEGFTTLRSTAPERFPGQNIIIQDLRKLHSWITPLDDYFAVAHYGIPEVDVRQWRLGMTGLAGRPMTLRLEELKRRPRVERTCTFECSGNSARRFHGMVGNATWAGANLGDLLQESRPSGDVKEVIFWAADTGTETIRGEEYEQHFARSMSLDDVMQAGAILAYEMNGHPLPVVHGFPVRLVVPGWYGICNVKWVERIELSASRLMTRFMARDYVTIMGRDVDGGTEWIETSVTRQRIKSVVARVTRTGARFNVFGVAWSDGTPLKSVEVQLDNGPWQQARLDRHDNPFSWTFWNFDTRGLAPGEHTLVSRVTDDRGRTQPVSLEMKKTRWENNALFNRTIRVAKPRQQGSSGQPRRAAPSKSNRSPSINCVELSAIAPGTSCRTMAAQERLRTSASTRRAACRRLWRGRACDPACPGRDRRATCTAQVYGLTLTCFCNFLGRGSRSYMLPWGRYGFGGAWAKTLPAVPN